MKTQELESIRSKRRFAQASKTRSLVNRATACRRLVEFHNQASPHSAGWKLAAGLGVHPPGKRRDKVQPKAGASRLGSDGRTIPVFPYKQKRLFADLFELDKDTPLRNGEGPVFEGIRRQLVDQKTEALRQGAGNKNLIAFDGELIGEEADGLADNGIDGLSGSRRRAGASRCARGCPAC
jgi:hypothetical protein